MSRYLSADEVLFFFLWQVTTAKKSATRNGFLLMMANKTGKKYLDVIQLLKKKWMTNHVPLLLQTTSFPNPKRGKQHLLQIMLVQEPNVEVWGVAQRRRCLRGMTVVACRDAGFPKRYQRGSLVVVLVLI